MAASRARVDASLAGGELTLGFTGRLDAIGVGLIWDRSIRAVRRAPKRQQLVFDLAGAELVDTAGAALLAAIEAAHGAPGRLHGATPQTCALLDRVRLSAGPPPAQAAIAALSLRRIATGGLAAAASGVAFVGETLIALVRLPLNRRMLRWRDMFRYADQAGVRSLPLVVLLGFLIGLILAFQSAVPMRRFGADLYVVNLVSISLLRELGPLLAAVILAGRTGSAFAAEIGTMRVNEEIDALVTMGVDPVTMLVLPRLIAAMLVMPAMTLVLDVAGLTGMGVVMVAFGFPPIAITNQIARAAHLGDLAQGLVKALCFGAAVAAIGCREGLATGVGPRAVGLAATGAVVGGIVATVLLDGLFALLLYRLGW